MNITHSTRLDQLVSELKKERAKKKNQSTKGKLQNTLDHVATFYSSHSAWRKMTRRLHVADNNTIPELNVKTMLNAGDRDSIDIDEDENY